MQPHGYLEISCRIKIRGEGKEKIESASFSGLSHFNCWRNKVQHHSYIDIELLFSTTRKGRIIDGK